MHRRTPSRQFGIEEAIENHHTPLISPGQIPSVLNSLRGFIPIAHLRSLSNVVTMLKSHFVLPTNTGWWFEPLWKILVNWDDYSQYMGNKKCSKPPTRTCSKLSHSQFVVFHPDFSRSMSQFSTIWRHMWPNGVINITPFCGFMFNIHHEVVIDMIKHLLNNQLLIHVWVDYGLFTPP